MNKQVIEWKWSSGEKYEKSQRKRNNQSQNQYNYDYDDSKIKKELENFENMAYQQALLSENDTWSLEEQQVFIKQSNRREETYNRMAEREMVGQIGMNPFVQRNYLDDVMTQDNFLKPISTSIEREKE